MAIAPNSTRSVDTETGRLRPLTDEEQARQLEAMARVFSTLAPPDETETEDAWAEVFRGIDESRPHRPLFKGAY